VKITGDDSLWMDLFFLANVDYDFVDSDDDDGVCIEG